MCESLAQGGSNFCNKHGGGEIPNCTTNTFRKRRCKKHRDTLMTEPEPDTEPDIDYVEGFMIISCVPEDPKPRNSAITTRLHAINQPVNSFDLDPEALQHLRVQAVDQLQEITVSTQSKPNWQKICEMVNRAKHLQPTAHTEPATPPDMRPLCRLNYDAHRLRSSSTRIKVWEGFSANSCKF